MDRRILKMCLFVFALIIAPVAASAADLPSAPPEPTLKSIYAGTHRLDEFTGKDTKAIVCAFLDTECPIAQKYIPRLTDIHERVSKKGVRVLGIYANTRVNIWSMAAHAQDSDISFPVFKDVDQRLADRLGVQITPEVVVLDAKL